MIRLEIEFKKQPYKNTFVAAMVDDLRIEVIWEQTGCLLEFALTKNRKIFENRKKRVNINTGNKNFSIPYEILKQMQKEAWKIVNLQKKKEIKKWFEIYATGADPKKVSWNMYNRITGDNKKIVRATTRNQEKKQLFPKLTPLTLAFLFVVNIFK